MENNFNQPGNFGQQSFESNPMMQSNLPNGNTVLVMGILSLVGCICYGIAGIIFGTIGLVIAKKDMKLYNQKPTQFANYSTLNTGRILCYIGLALSIIYIILLIIAFLFLGSDGIQHIIEESSNQSLQQGGAY